MEIQSCGGARTVTGSQHLVRVNGSNILLECGLYQGRKAEANEKNRSFLFNPAEIDAGLLSHAHIDRSGSIPTLNQEWVPGTDLHLCAFRRPNTAVLIFSYAMMDGMLARLLHTSIRTHVGGAQLHVPGYLAGFHIRRAIRAGLPV